MDQGEERRLFCGAPERRIMGSKLGKKSMEQNRNGMGWDVWMWSRSCGCGLHVHLPHAIFSWDSGGMESGPIVEAFRNLMLAKDSGSLITVCRRFRVLPVSSLDLGSRGQQGVCFWFWNMYLRLYSISVTWRDVHRTFNLAPDILASSCCYCHDIFRRYELYYYCLAQVSQDSSLGWLARSGGLGLGQADGSGGVFGTK